MKHRIVCVYAVHDVRFSDFARPKKDQSIYVCVYARGCVPIDNNLCTILKQQ